MIRTARGCYWDDRVYAAVCGDTVPYSATCTVSAYTKMTPPYLETPDTRTMLNTPRTAPKNRLAESWGRETVLALEVVLCTVRLTVGDPCRVGPGNQQPLTLPILHQTAPVESTAPRYLPVMGLKDSPKGCSIGGGLLHRPSVAYSPPHRVLYGQL